METCFTYYDKNSGFFSSYEQRWIRKIRKLKEEHPEEVQIIAEPEDNDGCIYCRIPSEWMRLQPKRKVDLSEEERAVLRDRMLEIRKKYSEPR